DLVGISLVITIIYFLYQNKNKFIYFLLSIIFLSALLFTQTRNAWLSSGVVMIGILIQYTIKSFKEKKSFSFLFLKVALFLTPIIFVIVQLNQSDLAIFERVNISAFSNTELTGETLKTTGSLITRLFIWDTALNAFLENPFTGIGLYTFPFLSFKYSTLDPLMYKMFVELLPPHQTFLAILCETGIIGFFGFIFLIYTTTNQSWQITKKVKSEEEKIYSTIILWLMIYIFVSMLMTDAWLWGNLFMLWTLLLGMSSANIKYILNKSSI
ncbi:MAG TPA: O-antigen ligase family protein, partial [Ignavibacteriaceae bacterium]|nr:O-antigen ligase family protein [Ignavibacteriaceae bacterium]